MNILITGGSGFIGTRLVEDLLKNNHNVRIYDKVTSEKYPHLVTIGDVRDKDALIKACRGIDIIYNLAAEHKDDVTPKSLYADVNIGGADNVVAAARYNKIKRIIFTSSVAIYGLNRGEPDETTDAKPFNEYGRTKYEAEKIFLQWANENQENSLVIVRPAVIFGERNRGNVYNLMKQIASGKFIMIGNGKNKKSMGYVGNISAFLASMAFRKSKNIEIFNFAGKPDLNTKEIVTIIRKEMGIKGKMFSLPYFIGLSGGYIFDIFALLTGKKYPVSSIRIKKFTAETTVSTKNLEKIGFKNPYTLEEGLKRMIQSEFFPELNSLPE